MDFQCKSYPFLSFVNAAVFICTRTLSPTDFDHNTGTFQVKMYAVAGLQYALRAELLPKLLATANLASPKAIETATLIYAPARLKA